MLNGPLRLCANGQSTAVRMLVRPFDRNAWGKFMHFARVAADIPRNMIRMKFHPQDVLQDVVVNRKYKSERLAGRLCSGLDFHSLRIVYQ